MKIERGAIVVGGAILTPAEWNADMARFMRQWEQAVAKVEAITEEISSHKPPTVFIDRPLTITEYIAHSVAHSQYEAEEAELQQRLGKAQDEREAIETKIIDLLPENDEIQWGKYVLSRKTGYSSDTGEPPYKAYPYLVVRRVQLEVLS